MKKTTIFFAVIFLTGLFAKSIFAQTTMEEYNYVIKGYKVQVESGLDMKKGYELETIDKTSTKERSAELKGLFRINDNKKEIAAYMIIYNRSGNSPEYICIPNPNSSEEIKNLYWTQLYDGSNDSSLRLQLISYLLSKHMKW